MKSCDEMVNSLMERRDRYVSAHKRRKAILTHTAVSMCCACLVTLIGLSVWHGGMCNTAPTEQTLSDALYPSIKDHFNEKNGESADDPTANNRIAINAFSGTSSDRMNICLHTDDFIELTREEMVEYYGVDYIPDVPTDIIPWEDERSGIFRRDGGSGEVYWDADILNFSNEDFTRNVHLEVDKGSYVLQDYLYFEGTEEKSIINNIEVLIGLTENGYYYAEFMYNGVGFLLDACGVTQDEFVSIIASVLD